MVEVIREKLLAAFPGATVCDVVVVDESCGKYSVQVVSEAFRPMKLLERHRAVNNALREELEKGSLHALTISAVAPS